MSERHEHPERLEAGVDRQSEDAADTRKHLRWGQLAKVYKENELSISWNRRGLP